MNPVRIGCVKYLNTLPLIEGLSKWRDAELVAAVPSRLSGMLRSGDVDVALASVIDAVGGGQGTSDVVLLPVGMIGCDGATLTVRLFSKAPPEKISRVAADTDSHTSVALLKVLLWKKYGQRVETVDYDARERMVVGRIGSEPEAVLLIGDKVVTDPPARGDYAYEIDLGAAWKDLTGLPFVYAVWMCRGEDWDAPEGTDAHEKVRMIAATLERQRRHNATRLDWVVASRAGERGWPEATAEKYVGTCLRYEVEEPERVAVEKFLMWAGELGLVPPSAAARVRWGW